MAAGGRRLGVGEVGERVAQWIERDTPLPAEWDGTPLMTLVSVCVCVTLFICTHTHTHTI